MKKAGDFQELSARQRSSAGLCSNLATVVASINIVFLSDVAVRIFSRMDMNRILVFGIPCFEAENKSTGFSRFLDSEDEAC